MISPYLPELVDALIRAVRDEEEVTSVVLECVRLLGILVDPEFILPLILPEVSFFYFLFPFILMLGIFNIFDMKG